MGNKVAKIVIVGAGKVGSTIAFCLVQQEIAKEVVLIDAKEMRAKAEVMDISHGLPLQEKSTQIRTGDYDECSDAEVVVITAAAPMKLGQTRLDMISKNTKIMDAIIPQIIESGFGGKIVVVSNPVDVISNYIQKKYQLDPKSVVGTGTILDSARFKCIFSEFCNVPFEDIKGYCIGEHGDALIIPWTQIECANKELEISKEQKEDFRKQTIFAAYDIMKGKGNTSYAIAISVITLIQAFFSEEKVELPISMLLDGEYGIHDVYLSIPATISKEKIQVKEVDLSKDEEQELQKAAEILKKTLDEVM